uniref:Uncharacterized protein n=1 Tax=uncultured organism TaxID=155900 RepID=M1Q2C1_9ZZZZ|nr:conserved hypothetical protein, secreted [uncultured organism]
MSVLVLGIAVTLAGAGTLAYFSDTETSAGNTFGAGILDLKVDGEDDPNIFSWDVGPMVPNESRFTGYQTLRNDGNVTGELTVTIENLKCLEHGLEEPENVAGDKPNFQWDPDSYSQESGYGELWDQSIFSIYEDSDVHGADDGGVYDDQKDWKDHKIVGGYADDPGGGDVPIGVKIVLDSDFEPGETIDVGGYLKFLPDDAGYGWILDGVPNNAAMGDEVKFDLKFELIQK